MNTLSLTKRNQSAIALVLVLFIAVLAFVLLKRYSTNDISFNLVTPRSDIVKGSEFTVDVALKDQIQDPVTAYEIFIQYDKSTLKLVRADNGGYFTDPLVIKWDLENGQFSAAANPSGFKDSAIKANMSNPLIRLTFQAMESATRSQITISDKSQLYVSQKGALSPGSVQLKFSVQ